MPRGKTYAHASAAIGDTPMIQINRVVPSDHATVFAKCEFFQPLNSVKDRIGVAMIEAAERDGLINADSHIIGSYIQSNDVEKVQKEIEKFKLTNGSHVLAKIVDYPARSKGRVSIIEEVHQIHSASSDTLRILVEGSWPRTFSQKAIDDAKKGGHASVPN